MLNLLGPFLALSESTPLPPQQAPITRFRPPTRSGAPARTGASGVSGSATVVSDANVDVLVGMGFPRDISRATLLMVDNNVSRAVDLLVNREGHTD